MAKKNGEKSEKKTLKEEIFSSFKDALTHLLLANLKGVVKDTLENVQRKIYQTVKKIFESALAMVILVMGLIMILISIPFFLAAYTNNPPSFYFLILGLILVFISFLSFGLIHKSSD